MIAHRAEILKQAWIGDAVLALYVRERILREKDAIDGELCERMSSNRFLSAFGDPSGVEAEIGRVYAAGGLAAAFAHIEAKLMPVFERQLQKRQKGLAHPEKAATRE